MKKIIAALDFSSATPVVMEHAISLAKSNNSELLLLGSMVKEMARKATVPALIVPASPA
jgi:nucleotide-binding universal stress UspA family protein